MLKLELSWLDPILMANLISQNQQNDPWVFLYSGLNFEVKKSRSYIAIFAEEKICGDDFLVAEKIIKTNNKKWFGYLSYEAGKAFEKMTIGRKSFIDLPEICLMRFGLILEFNHDKKKLIAEFSKKEYLAKFLSWRKKRSAKSQVKILELNSNFSDESYLEAISDIKERIAEGDFYQTNLTRKFFGKISQKNDFQLFCDLVKASPANYSSFLKFGETAIISSSPELFLKSKNRRILSRPIKGTVARGQNAKEDRANKNFLQKSVKECAENLMIVDLVRNDLARICKAGTVKVKKLFAINSYKNVHHMSSEIYGTIASDFCAIDAVKTCFPAGSMTGAPKIKAMEIAAKKELMNRGVYSGAIGIFAKNEINAAVVIRTLILQEEKFEFQVGGAITFDSDAKMELAEIFNKAKGLRQILGISNLTKN